MKLYEIVAYTLLGIGSMGLSGCDVQQTSKDSKKLTPFETDYFTDFGVVAENSRYGEHTELELGDVDGDGDIDIVLCNTLDRTIRIIENRIPQKTPEKQ